MTIIYDYHRYIPVILSPMLVCFDFFPLVSILLVLPFVWSPVGPGPPASSHCSSHVLLLVLLLIYHAVINRKSERTSCDFNENQYMGNVLKFFYHFVMEMLNLCLFDLMLDIQPWYEADRPGNSKESVFFFVFFFIFFSFAFSLYFSTKY